MAKKIEQTSLSGPALRVLLIEHLNTVQIQDFKDNKVSKSQMVRFLGVVQNPN